MNDFPSEDRDTELVGLGLPAIDCFACSACRRGYLTRAEKLRRGQMAKKKKKAQLSWASLPSAGHWREV